MLKLEVKFLLLSWLVYGSMRAHNTFLFATLYAVSEAGLPGYGQECDAVSDVYLAVENKI